MRSPQVLGDSTYLCALSQPVGADEVPVAKAYCLIAIPIQILLHGYLSGYLDIHRGRIIMLLAVPVRGRRIVTLSFSHAPDKSGWTVAAE